MPLEYFLSGGAPWTAGPNLLVEEVWQLGRTDSSRFFSPDGGEPNGSENGWWMALLALALVNLREIGSLRSIGRVEGLALVLRKWRARDLDL